VPSHHVLQRQDLPALSNWWGGFLLPLLAWFLLYRIQNRVTDFYKALTLPLPIVYGFLGALIFGILLSVFFTLGYTEIPFYMIVGLFFLALFLPIYRAVYFLGFIIGMTYTFGGVLPIGIISILSLINAILFLIFRPIILFMLSGLLQLVSYKKKL
jgi:hypothetical protein